MWLGSLFHSSASFFSTLVSFSGSGKMAALDFILSAQQTQEGEYLLSKKPRADPHWLSLYYILLAEAITVAGLSGHIGQA